MITHLSSRVRVAARMRWHWFLLPVLLAGAYLVYSYVRPHSYVVTATVPLPAAVVEEAAKAEQDLTTYAMGQLGFRHTPSQGTLASRLFYAHFSTPYKLDSAGIEVDPMKSGWQSAPRVRELVRNLSVSAAPEAGILLRYQGIAEQDARRALTQLAQELTTRVLKLFPTKEKEGAGAVASVQVEPVKMGLGDGAVSIALILLLAGVLLIFVVIGAVEMLGRELSSERQVAQYLGVEVVGALPKVELPSRTS